MNSCEHLRTPKILVIVLKHEFCCLFIECRLRKWLDEKTADDHQHVTNPMGRLPILFQSVHTYLTTRLTNVRMENLRKKKPCLFEYVFVVSAGPASP